MLKFIALVACLGARFFLSGPRPRMRTKYSQPVHRGHAPRDPRARGRSAKRGDYFPFDDEWPSNL
jgi:hypothetical protein